MIFLIATDTCYWIGCPISDIQDYIKIYEIKKRKLDKPISIMVESFDWLKKHTELNSKQIDFLKKYNKPFSILTNCDKIDMFLRYAWEYEGFPNYKAYKKISFRVANKKEQLELIKNYWPVFLTSANFSWENEIYNIEDLKKTFGKYLSKIKLLSNENLDSNVKPSDIFEFVWDSLEIKFLRKK